MSEEESKIILYTTDDGKSQVSLMSRDGRVWLNQKQMAELFAVSKPNISMLIAKIFAENELDDSVVKSYLTTAADGKRYNVIYYALEMILAVGFRVRGVRGRQFRQWANAHLSEYLVKGFTIDDARLKNPDGRPDYFDELLARIRDIRASEKRFYQKVRDLFALSSDYRGNEARTNQFYAEVQNKLLYAATGHTAAELVVERSCLIEIWYTMPLFSRTSVRKERPVRQGLSRTGLRRRGSIRSRGITLRVSSAHRRVSSKGSTVV